MTIPKPDWADYMRPDQIAECWDGVLAVPGLYEALWALPQTPIPNIEDSGPHDHIGHDCIGDRWDQLSEEHQAALLRLDRENNPSL